MENSQSTAKKGGFGKWAVVVAIVIVLNLFFSYAISLIYKAPSYESFVPSSQVVEPITNKADCVAVGGQWTNNDPRYNATVVPTPGAAVKPAPVLGYCDPNYTKQMKYEAAQKAYERNIFIILVVLGVISLVLGVVFVNAILAVAFSWGGVLSIIIAAMRYWSNANDIVRVLVLAAALGALIWVAVKKITAR
jgi:hypothetical protein